jgi:hypothetical protein
MMVAWFITQGIEVHSRYKELEEVIEKYKQIDQ